MKVDEIVASRLPREDEFKAIWPSGTHGFGKAGNLIYVDRVGSVDPSKLMGGSSGFTMDDVKKFHVRNTRISAHTHASEQEGKRKHDDGQLDFRVIIILLPPSLAHHSLSLVCAARCISFPSLQIQMMERVNRLKEEAYAATGVLKYKNIVILDLAGMGMSHMGSKFTAPMKSFIQIDQDFYPESLYQMVVTNAGWIVKSLWAIASPFIDPLTKERIKFGEKHLAEIIDVEQIPKFLGGKCKCKDGKCLQEPFVPGYEGGQLPPALQQQAQAMANAAAASPAAASSSSSAPAEQPAAAAPPAQ